MSVSKSANSLNRWYKCTSQVGLDKLLALFDAHLSGRDIMVMEFYNYESRKTVYLRLAIECGLWQYAMLCMELAEVDVINVSKDFKDKTISNLQLLFTDGIFEFRNGSEVIQSGSMKWKILSTDD